MIKNWKPIYWLYVAIVIIVIAIALYFIFRKPTPAPGPGNPAPKPKGSSNVLGTLLNDAGSWFSGLFSGGGGGGGGSSSGNPNDCEPGYTGYTNAGTWNPAQCLQSNCVPGTPSAGDPCTDTCGFAITSDQNPVCA